MLPGPQPQSASQSQSQKQNATYLGIFGSMNLAGHLELFMLESEDVKAVALVHQNTLVRYQRWMSVTFYLLSTEYFGFSAPAPGLLHMQIQSSLATMKITIKDEFRSSLISMTNLISLDETSALSISSDETK